jgi:hypothetical protein
MQLEAHELYSLIDLIDPALFPTEEHFKRNHDDARGLNHLVEQLRQHGFPLPGRDPDETITQVATWLGIDADLASDAATQGIQRVCKREDLVTGFLAHTGLSLDP